jgi:hypothetical protein
MSVSAKPTLSHNPEDNNLNNHHRENWKNSVFMLHCPAFWWQDMNTVLSSLPAFTSQPSSLLTNNREFLLLFIVLYFTINWNQLISEGHVSSFNFSPSSFSWRFLTVHASWNVMVIKNHLVWNYSTYDTNVCLYKIYNRFHLHSFLFSLIFHDYTKLMRILYNTSPIIE